jgi:hypothetical protein
MHARGMEIFLKKSVYGNNKNVRNCQLISSNQAEIKVVQISIEI